MFDQLVEEESSVHQEEPLISTERLDELLKDMLQDAGIITHDKDVQRVRSALARRMQDNSRRSFVNLALNNELAKLVQVEEYYDTERKPMSFLEHIFTEDKDLDQDYRLTMKVRKSVAVPSEGQRYKSGAGAAAVAGMAGAQLNEVPLL